MSVPFNHVKLYKFTSDKTHRFTKCLYFLLFFILFTANTNGQKITNKFLIGTWEGRLESFIFLNDSIVNYKTSDFIRLKMKYKLIAHSNIVVITMQGCDSGCTNFRINCLIKSVNRNSIKMQSSFSSKIITKWDPVETEANTEILMRKAT